MEKKKKIIVVDDEVRFRNLVAITLRNHGCEVREAAGAGEFAAILKETLPDAVVLDLMLPDKTGVEICADLKADPRTSAIPVLLLSGITQGLSRRDEGFGRRCLADDFLAKPFKLADMVSRLENLLSGAAARR